MIIEYFWQLDPLLFYAFFLTLLLFSGIFICAFVIFFHHVNYLRQKKIGDEFETFLGDQDQIALNAFFLRHPKVCLLTWIRWAERQNFEERLASIQMIGAQIFEDEIEIKLNSIFIMNRLVAIEAVGLGRLKKFKPHIERACKKLNATSFAARALIRLEGTQAVELIHHMYGEQQLTKTQYLSALLEVAPEELDKLKERTSTDLPGLHEILQILKSGDSR